MTSLITVNTVYSKKQCRSRHQMDHGCMDHSAIRIFHRRATSFFPILLAWSVSVIQQSCSFSFNRQQSPTCYMLMSNVHSGHTLIFPLFTFFSRFSLRNTYRPFSLFLFTLALNPCLSCFPSSES